MFWVIFDTSTRRDYYRDVHNLLALPPGSTIRYDYGEYHMSAAAIEEARKGGTSRQQVLLTYAQTKSFRKGDLDPVGPIGYRQGLWIGTRLASLGHLRFSVNRYYFDLKLLGYPAADDAAFGAIMQRLADAHDVPFVKWVVISDLDASFRSLTNGAASDNWTSIVNRIGNLPSQFAGDNFWRISRITNGALRVGIEPLMRDHLDTLAGQEARTGVEAVYPVVEQDKLSLQIESRMPEIGEEPRGREPETARIISFQTASDGPLKDLNDKTLMLRRYASEWVEIDVSASDRIDPQDCDLSMTTGPAEGTYPIGPELKLRFQATKNPGKSYLALVFAVIAAALIVIGAELFKDHAEWGIVSIFVAVILGILSVYLWSGRVKLPGK